MKRLTNLIPTLRLLDTTMRTRFLVLFVVSAVATLIAAAATGVARFGLFNAIVAIVCAASGAVSLRAVRSLVDPTVPETAPEQRAAASRTRLKAVLALTMVAGAVGYVGGHGTFAIFTAEDSNSGTQITSGTLALGDTVNAGSTCYSYSGSTLDNVNNGCTALVSPPNMAPGSTVAQSKLVVENDGSLDAGTVYLEAPWPKTTLSTPLTNGSVPTSNQLVLSSGLNVALANGNSLTLSYQGHSQTYTVSGAVSVGATTIPLTSPAAANFSYPAGTRVEDVSGNTTVNNMDCYDQKTQNASWPASGSAPGTILPFVTTTGNPLCAGVLFWVQEQTNGVSYCWVGRGSSGSAAPATNGQCRTPTTMTLTGSALSTVTATTTLNVQALTGNVASGDQITLTESGHTDTFSAAADAYIGATTITVTSHTANFAYDTSATVKDKTAFDDLNGDAFDTIANFDTNHRPTAPVQLYPLTTNTTAPNSLATVSLGKQGSSGNAGYQRTFYIGVFLPAPSGQAQNQLQGLISTFGLTWHIEQ